MTLESLRVARVLCPTDFSVFSAHAFRHALALAHQFRARVKVVHVLPLPNIGAPELSTGLLPLAEQRQLAAVEMRRFVEPAAGSGVEVTTEIREGQPWREILAAAHDLPADLVALGTHGRSGLERFVLGSVTEKLLALLPCPTLTVCHEERRTWETPGLVKRILVATDFSPAAAGAVALALPLAEKSRSEVTLLHVIDTLPDASEHVHFAVPEIAPLRHALEEQATPRLQAAAPDTLANGLPIRKRLATGPAPDMILKVATEMRADLIVLGRRGHGALGRFLFGSTSDRVVRDATCPVVTLPPPGEAPVVGREAERAAVQGEGTVRARRP